MSGSVNVHGAAISRCVFPFEGSDHVAAGGIFCSAAGTEPCGDASVGRGLV